MRGRRRRRLAKRTQRSCGVCIEPRKESNRRGRGGRKRRRQYERSHYARGRRSAVVTDHITHERIGLEPGRSHTRPQALGRRGPHREGEEPKPMTHGHEKSGLAVGAVKPANKAEPSAAEPEEPRAEPRGMRAAQHALGSGRVGDWRAGLGRSLCSLLARSFVCECHTISTVPRFQPPPRRTQHADFPHCALLFASPQDLWDLSCRRDFRS